MILRAGWRERLTIQSDPDGSAWGWCVWRAERRRRGGRAEAMLAARVRGPAMKTFARRAWRLCNKPSEKESALMRSGAGSRRCGGQIPHAQGESFLRD
jgi:hypothetical protein